MGLTTSCWCKHHHMIEEEFVICFLPHPVEYVLSQTHLICNCAGQIAKLTASVKYSRSKNTLGVNEGNNNLPVVAVSIWWFLLESWPRAELSTNSDTGYLGHFL